MFCVLKNYHGLATTVFNLAFVLTLWLFSVWDNAQCASRRKIFYWRDACIAFGIRSYEISTGFYRLNFCLVVVHHAITLNGWSTVKQSLQRC